jgi:hypothetical protein
MFAENYLGMKKEPDRCIPRMPSVQKTTTWLRWSDNSLHGLHGLPNPPFHLLRCADNPHRFTSVRNRLTTPVSRFQINLRLQSRPSMPRLPRTIDWSCRHLPPKLQTRFIHTSASAKQPRLLNTLLPLALLFNPITARTSFNPSKISSMTTVL